MKKAASKNKASSSARAKDLSAEQQTRGLELLQSEARYRKMIEEIEDYAIFLLDEEGNVLDWNPGAERIKGYRREEIVGKNFRLFYLPEDRKNKLPETLIERAKREGKALHEGWRLRKDGTRFWGSIVITALHDDQNRVIGFSKVARDLSERRIAELNAIRYSNELEFQNKELEQFAYVASHDLKEPLRKIQMYMSILSSQYKGALDAAGSKYFEKTLDAARRMQQLIDDLLAYSKGTMYADRTEDVNVTQLVSFVCESYTDSTATGFTPQIGDLPTIRGIPFQIRQLADNLVGNAIKYKHPDRALVLQITSQVVPVLSDNDDEMKHTKEYHKISFIDNGIGFDNSHAKRIFDIFQRLHHKIDFSGSGIGLAICKKVMQNHKGFLQAYGTPNEGARFDCFFPTEHVTEDPPEDGWSLSSQPHS